MIRSPIGKQTLYAEPESFDALAEYIMRHSSESRPILFTVAGMTRNVCAAIVEDWTDTINDRDQEAIDKLVLAREMATKSPDLEEILDDVIDLINGKRMKDNYEITVEAASELSYDILWAHNPTLDGTDPDCETLIDCYPHTGDAGITVEQFEKAIAANRVWTEVEGDEFEYMHVLPGYHRVNRQRHFITATPYKLKTTGDDPLAVDMSDFPDNWRDKF